MKERFVVLVRHGLSIANKHMSRPRCRWGDPTFWDDPELRDSPLSPEGIIQAKSLAHKGKEYLIPSLHSCLADSCGEKLTGPKMAKQTSQPVLVAVSPLTRCLQTLDYGIIPILLQFNLTRGKHYNVLAHPLCTERVYTCSDLGRPVSELKLQWPHVDFDEQFIKRSGTGKLQQIGENEIQMPTRRLDFVNVESAPGECWWYSPRSDQVDSSVEWRPHGSGQIYSCPGEPYNHFAKRMATLYDWLYGREEMVIVLVTHWGVIEHLTGQEFHCGEMKVFKHSELRRGIALEEHNSHEA